MYNIHSHVQDIRGETFTTRPFDTLDSLVLTQLSYMPMEGLSEASDKPTVRTLGELYLSQINKHPLSSSYQRNCNELALLCATSTRYAALPIQNFVNHIDPDQETQFCACTFVLPGGEHYIAFRGTDVSIAGWKEDFNMSFMTVPAQQQAARYVEETADACSEPIYLGGHSKGGNLALYAACHVTPDVQPRIAKVYSFDGPGLDKQSLDSPAYQAVRERIQSWIPQSSVVGMLLCYHPDYKVVRSKAIGLMQHDVFTWQIENGRFKELDELTFSTRVSNEAFNHWLDQQTAEERRFLVDVIFKIVSGIGVTDFSPLVEDLKGQTQKLFSAFHHLDFETRTKAVRLLAGLLSTEAGFAVKQLLASVFRTQES